MFKRVLAILFLFSLVQADNCTPYLYSTAVVSEPDGVARIECWRFITPLKTYPTVGAALTLADVSNVTYVVLPPRSGEGIHKPPHPMLFILLSGLAHVTLPYGEDEVWIMEGVNGLLVANDVTGIGHYTDYPSDKETVALQLPFRDGKLPDHIVVYNGSCKASNQVQDQCIESSPYRELEMSLDL